MNCTRCLKTVTPALSNVHQLSLNHIGVNVTLNKLNCDNCQICVYLSVSSEEWENVDALLHKRKKLGGNGWEIIEEKDEFIKLYVLSQVVYNEIEGSLDASQIPFAFPDKTDLVKILWKDGNAIGFYTLKLKDSIVLDTMEAYGMTTLDTAYVRKPYRKNGFGLSILEDIVKSFPDEDLGISTPVSRSMYYVVHKFLTKNPSYKTKLWEVSGVGSEGNRKLIYYSLKSLSPMQRDSSVEISCPEKSAIQNIGQLKVRYRLPQSRAQIYCNKNVLRLTLHFTRGFGVAFIGVK